MFNMKNLIFIFSVLLLLIASCNEGPVIDKSHFLKEDHVEDFSEMKEALFPNMFVPDSIINAIDSFELKDSTVLLEFLQERFDSTGYTDTLIFGTINPDLMEARSIGKKTLYVNIHCTASREGVDLSGEWLEDFFKYDRGWSKNGYNEVVLLDGTRYVLEPYNLDGYTTWDEVSYGVRGRNSESINIAYIGGVDRYMRPKDTRTVAQKRAIDQIVYEIKCYMPDVTVHGHRDNPNVAKSCPSYDVKSDYKLFLNER